MGLPRPAQFRGHLETITRVPHPAGSAAQRDVENYLAQVMESAGLESSATPTTCTSHSSPATWLPRSSLTERLTLSEREPALPEDRFSGHPDLLNGWNAYSGSGDVTEQVVYANFGRKEDFDYLDEIGVSITDKVVIARYGGNFRGYKVKFAQERGAAGMIVFNDPGEAIRHRRIPARTEYDAGTIQRGSLLTLSYTGGPAHPLRAAYPVDSGIQVDRLDPSEWRCTRFRCYPSVTALRRRSSSA